MVATKEGDLDIVSAAVLHGHQDAGSAVIHEEFSHSEAYSLKVSVQRHRRFVPRILATTMLGSPATSVAAVPRIASALSPDRLPKSTAGGGLCVHAAPLLCNPCPGIGRG